VQQWFPRGTRVGHTGTLDPLATGVLVVCIGVATRLAEYVQDMSKTYLAGIRLGARSATDDADGTIDEVAVVEPPTSDEIAAALRGFIGVLDQVPPRFSAAKVTGQRAYDLARRGKEVTLAPRRVAIYRIEVRDYAFPRLELEIDCGKGTYIRSLARDLGDQLGCGALVQTLRRTRVGPFRAENAIPLTADAEAAIDCLLPPEMAVSELPRIDLDAQSAQVLMHGRAVPASVTMSDQICAAFGPEGKLLAVGKWSATQRLFEPDKVVG
jgi:tRNA pseudouridine55 synthase